MSGCMNCLTNSRMCRSASTQVRKHPVYVMAGILLLQFLAEIVIFADLLTDLSVAYVLATAELNWLYVIYTLYNAILR